MELSQVLARIEGLVLRGELTTNVTSIEYDSRKVKSGSMFVAIKGFKTDGHEFISNAINNGANAIYLAGYKFGAREKATFSNKELVDKDKVWRLFEGTKEDCK